MGVVKMATKPKVRRDLVVYEADEELVIYDPKAGGVHHLNPLGALVFRLCDGTATVRQTAFELADALDIPVEQLDPQVRAIVKEFRSRELVERPRTAAAEIEVPLSNEDGDQRERIRLEVPRST